MPTAFGFFAGLFRRMAGGAPADVEILPPEQRPAKPKWDLNMSAEERADVFASLFLNASPKDARVSRMENFREQ
jgi:hypothetical protein